MTDYIRGQRVRITNPTLSEEAHLIGATGTVVYVLNEREDLYAVRLDSGQTTLKFYPSEFEPVGEVLTEPEQGDTVTINGVPWELITNANSVAHIRVSPDLIVQWEALVALGFTLDERETTEGVGA